jgi:hypothetical protein
MSIWSGKIVATAIKSVLDGLTPALGATVVTSALSKQAYPYIYLEVGPTTLPPDGHAVDKPSEQITVRVRIYTQGGNHIDDTFDLMSRVKQALDGATLTLSSGSFAYCLFVDADRVIPFDDGQTYQGVVSFRVRVDEL